MGDGLLLTSESLFSKWGFNDGDTPDLPPAVDDLLRATEVTWHDVLRRLVRTHLVPRIEKPLIVTDVESAHNPVRVYDWQDGEALDFPMGWDLDEPVVVTVTWDDVVDAIVATKTGAPLWEAEPRERMAFVACRLPDTRAPERGDTIRFTSEPLPLADAERIATHLSAVYRPGIVFAAVEVSDGE